MRKFKFYLIITLAILAASCSREMLTDQGETATADGNTFKSAQPHLKIAVMSDLHYLDPTLLLNAEGAAFQEYLMFDPKLIQYSEPILKEAIAEIIAAKPDMLLIPGDLTKDGEKVCHEAVAGLLREVADNGIKIFVVPGNHDINNPEAVEYGEETATPVPSVTAEEFAEIYAGFGYGEAISRDQHSLSYLCQPYNNLWVLGIDACKYAENTDKAIVEGAIKPETMSWIQEKLAEAKKKNITVLALMHHGVIEHYSNQEVLDPGYLVDNWRSEADALIDAGLKVIFTGHNHGNDIASRTKGENALSDIETGSLVTPLSPWRFIDMDPNFMHITTNRITSIDAEFPYGMDFLAYSDAFITAHLEGIFAHILQSRFGVPEPYASEAAPFYTEAMKAYYAGDEVITPSGQAAVEYLKTLDPTQTLSNALLSFWTDLTPADNRLTIEMRKKLK